MKSERVVFGRVLNAGPLITISKRALFLDQPMGFAPFLPDLARAGPSLHLVGVIFSMETDQHEQWGMTPDSIEALARDHIEVSRRFPDARFVILGNTEGEMAALARVGLPCMLANELIFTDEFRFGLASDAAPFDIGAVYNAMFHPIKRHYLAEYIEKLALIFKMPEPAEFDAIAAKLPRARYVNLSGSPGAYVWRPLPHEEVVGIYARSEVGLCLSAVEGAMRVSMEYLMCGLPVVSTPSLGGRDRYFHPDYATVCDPTPTAVAEAVREAASKPLPRAAIRQRVMVRLRADRADFLAMVNDLIARELQAPFRFDTFEAFRHTPIHARKLRLMVSGPCDAGL